MITQFGQRWLETAAGDARLDGGGMTASRYLGESAGVGGNRPGDELVRGEGPDHGGNRNPPPGLFPFSGVRYASWCVHTGGDGCCWCLACRSDQNLDRGLLQDGVTGGGCCCWGDGGGVAGGGDRLGDHTGQDGDLITSHNVLSFTHFRGRADFFFNRDARDLRDTLSRENSPRNWTRRVRVVP